MMEDILANGLVIYLIVPKASESADNIKDDFREEYKGN